MAKNCSKSSQRDSRKKKWGKKINRFDILRCGEGETGFSCEIN